MQTKNAGEEHHCICEGKSRGEEGSGCEDVDDAHVALPGVVELLIEHVGLHFVLLLVEGID